MSAPADPRAREGEAGFTLVEMLVALMIFALSVALAGSFITRRGPQPPYQTAKAMQSMLLRARSDAIVNGADTIFVIDTNAKYYAYPKGSKPIRLPQGHEIRMVTGGEFATEEGQTYLIYRADGSSSGAEIVLSDGRTSDARIEVNWLTGVPLLTRGASG